MGLSFPLYSQKPRSPGPNNKFRAASRIVAGFEIKRKIGGDFPDVINGYIGSLSACFDHI